MKVTQFGILIFFTAVLASADPTFDLIPSNGTVSGSDGAVVGWGFSVTEPDAGNWLLLTGSSFTGSTLNGNYVDYLASAFDVAGPSPEMTTLTQNWDQTSQLGVGEFDISPTASPGPIDGNLIVHYSVFSQDPNDPFFSPDTSTVIADATFTAPVEIDVAAANTVPEPAPVGLVPVVLLALAWRHRKLQRLSPLR